MTPQLDTLLAGYLDLRWHLNPVQATAAGRHEHDGTFARYDRTSVREHAAALRSFTSALEEAEADTLDDEIDRTAALHFARHDLLVLERERPFARNAAMHVGHALNGLWLLLARQGIPDELRAAALLSRLRALPAFLQAAADALAEPSAVFLESASRVIPGGLALIRDGMDAADIDLSSLDASELVGARAGAEAALLEFGDWLALAEERADASFAIGRELFDRKLHTGLMIRESADELFRYGERLVAETRVELERAAEVLAPGMHWRELAERLRADRPTRESAVDEYAAAMRAAREFAVGRGLVDDPSAELRVIPTPDFLRSLIPFAAYQGPGAFESDQTGIFFVTLGEPGEPWRLHCRAELPSTALHEGVPGHHAQVVVANRSPRHVRRVLTTPAAQEGWALYCESLMADAGFIASPEERFFQLHHLLWRALRIVLDVALHTRGMTVQAAAAVLEQELGMDAPTAMAEARRYCAYPTYQLSYAVGRREILALRDDVRRARGSAFSLPDFHRELLSYGALPTALARWGMGLA
ncbi:MAG: DUF885 domain-containing protein [Gemmatimonadaceae bacterium]